LDGDGHDASGHGWDLTTHDVEWVAGRHGLAAQLSGVSSYLERAGATALNPGAGGWTVNAWVQAVDVPLHGAVVGWYRCGANPACSSVDGALYLLRLIGGHPEVDVRDDSNVDADLPDTQGVEDIGWHLLSGTLSESDRRLRLYVDGTLVATGSPTFGALSGGAVSIPLSIGRIFRTGWAAPHSYLRGRVDDVRIYARALSTEEVRSLYTEGGWPFLVDE